MSDIGWPTPGPDTLHLTSGDMTWSYQLRDAAGNPVNFPAGRLFVSFPTISGASYGTTSASGSLWQWTVYGSVATITVPAAVVSLIPDATPWYLVWIPDAQGRFDAAGDGYTGTSTTPSWSHTVNGTAVVVFANIVTTGTTPGTVTATCGGVSMTPLSALTNYYAVSPTGNNVSLYALGLITSSIGVKTIAMNFSGWGSTHQIAANSLSYSNVDHFSTAVTESNSSGSAGFLPNLLRMYVSSAQNMLVTQAFSGYTGVLSNYGQSQRFSLPFSSGNNVALLAGDAPIQDIAHQPALSFTANNTTAGWAGIAVPMMPTAASKSAGYALKSGVTQRP